MQRYFTFLVFSCACLLASILPVTHAAASLTPEPTDRSVGLKSLARDISKLTKTQSQVLQDAGDDLHVLAFYLQGDFETIANKPDPNKDDFASIGHMFWELAIVAPGIYRSLLADPSIRGRLFESEKSFQTSIFADSRSNTHAKALLEQIRLLAENMVAERPDKKAERIDNDFHLSRKLSKISSQQELDAALQNLGEALGSANELPVSRNHAAVVLVLAAKFLHGHLIAEAKIKELEFGKYLMRYLGDGHRWQAYDLFRHFATLEPDDAAMAAKLGEVFLQTHCKSASSADYVCLNTLSLLQFQYQILHDPSHLRKTRARLDEALKQNLKLKRVLSQADVPGKKDSVVELQSLIPRLGNLGGEYWFEDNLRISNELNAVSYWLIKAAGKNPQQLVRMLSSQQDSFFSPKIESELLMIMTMAYRRAIELEDGKVAQLAASMMRSEFEKKAEGMSSNNPKLLQVRVSFDIMELLALQISNNLPQSRRIVQRIKSNIAPFLMQRRAVDDGIMTTCPPPAEEDGFLGDSAQPDFFESVHNLITQLEIQWDIKEGKQISLQTINTALSLDIRDLFRPQPSGASRQLNNNQEEPPEPLSPAQFIIQWEKVYRPAFVGNTDKLRQAATTIKCLLGQPSLEMKLSADLINKRSTEKAELGKAIFHLIEDSGTLAQGRVRVADDDFRLLQLVSVLQAHTGISAAAARSVFPSEVREQVRQVEADLGNLKRNIDSIQSMVNFVKQGGGPQGGMLSTLMQVAIAYPDAYAKYSNLRQQSITTLDGITKVLGSDEAAVLFSSAGEKLLAVVVRKSGGTIIPIKVSVSTLQATVSQLLASLRLPSDRIHSLPSKFRADAAWKVYQQVFQPFEDSLAGASTVYLVGGEVLADLPFQTLLTAQPPPQDKVDFSTYRRLSWLGDRFAFVSLPSMHSLRRLSERHRQDTAAKLWGVGEPAISATALQAMKLVGIPDTAHLLVRAGKPDDPQPLLGARATYANFASQSRNGILSKADIVLINSHTLAAGQGERYGTKDAAIVLAPSSLEDRVGADLLPPSKVVEQNLPVRLTMLLACKTAGGISAGHEQPFAGLVNAFFFSGADSVLATVRLVNSEASEDLAVNFLRHVRDDRMSSAEALQRASTEVRCPDDKSPCAAGKKFVWAHPAYWAQFMLVGSGR
ncbi:MAG: CHAT domain-containing protein [Gallionella sp.]|nr:CHAT domain-containing protein [Gallionella sp.]